MLNHHNQPTCFSAFITFIVFFLSTQILWPITAHAQYPEYPVDLELVLALDASGSVDDEEYHLQLKGIASAFRDSKVIEVIQNGFHGKIAVAVMVWADAHVDKDVGTWYVIASPDDAEAFALQTEYRPRLIKNGATGIGASIGHAIQMMQRNGLKGIRRVVDVSGDGFETPLDTSIQGGKGGFATAMLLGDAHKYATQYNVIVNGLAITNDIPDLDIWYHNNVKIGSGSFVIKANSYENFAAKMRTKLLREIEQTTSVTRSLKPGPREN